MPKLFGKIASSGNDGTVFVVDSRFGDAMELGLVGELALPTAADVTFGHDHDMQLDTVTMSIALAQRLNRSTQPCD
ncbi:hypothetical protein [Anatilimnocola floriformis]|uniref:hypothetical protein n=1 Tax=Anatilimnocola floriformis TaxID=2948575 RepID=UPI0020C30A93|nr:hypothetical protein [Anatilimnocola floriformis]